ncbi:MAG: OB-fold protein [Anaerovoracaceae bacterium]
MNKMKLSKKFFNVVIAMLLTLSCTLVFTACGSQGGDSDAAEQQKKSRSKATQIYDDGSYSAGYLESTLEKNEKKARKKFKNQTVTVHGYLGFIDENGDYCTIEKKNDSSPVFIHCTFQEDSQRQTALEIGEGNPVVVSGEVIEASKDLGYYIDIDSIDAD